MNFLFRSSVGLAMLFTLDVSAHAAGLSYRFIDLGLSGPDIAGSQAGTINNYGQLSVLYTDAEASSFTTRALIRDPVAGFYDPGPLIYGTPGISNAAITDTGQILGPHFIYTPGVGAVFPYPGVAWYPADINTSGQVVGGAGLPDQVTHGTQAFFYTPASGTQHLGTLDGSLFSSSLSDINNGGHAVGQSSIASADGTYVERYVAIAYSQADGMRELSIPGAAESGAAGINDQGDIIGFFRKEGSVETQAFILRPGQALEELGTIGGYGSSFAAGMNEAGDVVGYSNTFAFLYREGVGMVNLDQFRPANSDWVRLTYATDINDRGEIVGNGLVRVLIDPENDVYEIRSAAFLLQPVPEPETWALLGVGLVAVGWSVRRRR